MNISSTQTTPVQSYTVSNQATQVTAPAVQEQAPDQVEVYSKHIDEKAFSWGDLGKGITGSVIAGAIDGVGGLAAGIVKTPRVTYEALKGTWSSKMLGPILKTSLTPVILTAGIGAPVLAGLAGLGFGLFQGFNTGAEKNPLEAGSEAIEDCKKMHGKFTKHIVEGIRDAAAREPQKPEDIYEISILEAGKGLVGAAAGSVIDGVGIAGTVAWHTPEAYFRANKEMWTSDISLPLKVGGTFLATAAVPLATPLAAVAGGLYGLGQGAYQGYQNGISAAFGKAAEDFVEVNKAINKALDEN